MVRAFSCKTHPLTGCRDSEVSHITAGYWYNSAEHGKIRVDEAYDGSLASSLCDFTDMNADGGIMNHLITVGPSMGSEPSCFDDYLQAPGFPLITEDFLKSANATFGGVIQEPLLGVTQTVGISRARCDHC